MVERHSMHPIANMAKQCHIVLLCALILASGCGKKSDDSTLLEAWKLCEALEYTKASPMVRDYLLRHPRNSVAHYLLGKCYQQQEKPALTLAKGELDMARSLFEADGDLSVLANAMTPAEYQSTLHCDTVLVLLRTIIDAEEEGMPPRAGIPLLRIALEHAQKAAFFNPKSVFILDLTHTLETMLDAASSTPAPEKPVKPSLPSSSPGKWLT